jgi:hypothetical protein
MPSRPGPVMSRGRKMVAPIPSALAARISASARIFDVP